MTHRERASQFIKSMLQPKMSEEQWKDFLTQRRGKEALGLTERLEAEFADVATDADIENWERENCGPLPPIALFGSEVDETAHWPKRFPGHSIHGQTDEISIQERQRNRSWMMNEINKQKPGD